MPIDSEDIRVNIQSCFYLNRIETLMRDKKLESIFYRLFKLLNNQDSNKKEIINIWLNHINISINKFLDSLDETEQFIENCNKNDNIILKLENKDINNLYIISLAKKKVLL